VEKEKTPLIKYLARHTMNPMTYVLLDNMPSAESNYGGVIEVEIKRAWKLEQTYKEMENTNA